MYTERTHVLLSPDQVARLKTIARRDGRSVSAVIRQAIDAYTTAPLDHRREAIERLLAMEGPVDDWPVMKDQIVRGATAERRRTTPSLRSPTRP